MVGLGVPGIYVPDMFTPVHDTRRAVPIPDARNEINASRRQREAAFEKGEADKLLKIKVPGDWARCWRSSLLGLYSWLAV